MLRAMGLIRIIRMGIRAVVGEVGLMSNSINIMVQTIIIIGWKIKIGKLSIIKTSTRR